MKPTLDDDDHVNVDVADDHDDDVDDDVQKEDDYDNDISSAGSNVNDKIKSCFLKPSLTPSLKRC